jgi:hypothetical protein
MSTRSVAKADVAELSAALDSAVDQEKEHHLVIVSTNKVLSTTQFKQMFYSRGDDFFQIANVYECPDSCDSVHSSVWGIDCSNAWAPSQQGNDGLVEMPWGGGDHRLSEGDIIPDSADGLGSIAKQQCYNFNKLGGRENDPPGCAWAYSYVHDQARNFYAQHEVMGYLEKDTCVKRDFWTACSRMSIEDQLYGLAFASETDQDLCMAVTCARRWSEVEDALAESCTAADRKIAYGTGWTWTFPSATIATTNANKSLTIDTTNLKSGTTTTVFTYTAPNTDQTADEIVAAINGKTAGRVNYHSLTGYNVTASSSALDKLTLILEVDSDVAVNEKTTGTNIAGNPPALTTAGQLVTTAPTPTIQMRSGGHVDLYINVRVSNGHPKALDTILRVRFTVIYHRHLPSALHTWNTRASTASSGVINTGVVGDAPEGGKQQHEDTTVVA